MKVVAIDDVLYEVALSPSGNQVLAWRTFASGGAEPIALPEGARVAVIDDVEWVVSGVIADEGSGALIVGLPQRSKRDHQGRLAISAFDSEHEERLHEELGSAIPTRLTIADDGSFVACLVASDARFELRCYDLRAGRLAWQLPAPRGVSGLRFSVDSSLLILEIGSIEMRLNASTGAPVDEEEQARLAVGREPFEPLIWVEAALRQTRDPSAEELESWEGILRATVPVFQGQERATSYPSWEARAWRSIGEIQELRGSLSEAAEAYDRALALDSRVGVVRKLAALRARL